MTGPSAPFAVDLPHERNRIRRQSALAFVVCTATLGASLFWLPQRMAFPEDMAARFSFVLRASLFIVMWLLGGIGWVSTIRRYSAQDNPGSAFGEPSHRLAIPLAFLQNTLEQVFITLVSFLALATVEGGAPMAYVLGSVPLFALGRIAFLRGYPKGAGARAFGMAMTALPALGAYVWVAWDILSSAV